MKKTAIVTGASKGIGLATAEALAAEGYTVYGLSRSEGGLADIVRQTEKAGGKEGSVRWIYCDITDSDSVKQAFDQVLAERGRLDVLVCNAGVGISGAAEFTPESDYIMQMDVNVTGTVRCANTAVPVMREQGGGRIVFISSLAAIFPLPFSGLLFGKQSRCQRFQRRGGDRARALWHTDVDGDVK